jgi:hypothetical protein
VCVCVCVVANSAFWGAQDNSGLGSKFGFLALWKVLLGLRAMETSLSAHCVMCLMCVS